MRAETMMNEYPKMKKELAMLDLQLKYFRGVSEVDIIDSMTFSAPQSGDRVQNNKTYPEQPHRFEISLEAMTSQHPANINIIFPMKLHNFFC